MDDVRLSHASEIGLRTHWWAAELVLLGFELQNLVFPKRLETGKRNWQILRKDRISIECQSKNLSVKVFPRKVFILESKPDCYVTSLRHLP